VYTKKDGTMHITWTSYTKPVVMDNDGRFVCDVKAATINSVSTADFINRLLKSTGPVQVISLPSDFGTRKSK